MYRRWLTPRLSFQVEAKHLDPFTKKVFSVNKLLHYTFRENRLIQTSSC